MGSIASCPVVLVVAACSFRAAPLGAGEAGDGAALDGPNPGDDAGAIDALRIDAPPPPVLHLPPDAWLPGAAPLVVGSATIDTSALTIDGAAPPAGVIFAASPQVPGGPELAVLHVLSLTVAGGATVRVVGERPLVVVAQGAILVEGVVDAAARRNQPGAGGMAPTLGMGAGQDGAHAGTYRDSGGGGAGFGAAGAAGGDARCAIVCAIAVGGAAGAAYGDSALSVLQGGSGGGSAPRVGCGTAPPGAGGGAVQLTSATRVEIASGGGLGAGGGGGGEGRNGSCDWGAGSGGVSGGALVLQSPVVVVRGILAANGGGGGGGAGAPAGTGSPGTPGQDGALGASPAAGGLAGGTPWGSPGGRGGALGSAPQAGATNGDDDGNGGGGGGAAGRIAVFLPAGGNLDEAGGVSSPARYLGAY